MDLKECIVRFSPEARRSLDDTAGLACQLGHRQITLAHLVVALSEKDPQVRRWLDAARVDRATMSGRIRGQLQRLPAGAQGVAFSAEVLKLIAVAAGEKSDVTSLDLFRALFRTPDIYAALIQLAPEFRPLPPPESRLPPTLAEQAHAELLERANSEARSCVLLKRVGSPERRAASWRGPGVVPAGDDRFEHRLSFDCRYLAPGLGPAEGVVSLYLDDDETAGLAVHDPSATLDRAAGEPLFAHPTLSLPPPIALSAEGDEAYEQAWQANCPLYSKTVVAVLGGWHFPWPDDDWHERRAEGLVAWTIADSEPWLELWQAGDTLRVRARIT